MIEIMPTERLKAQVISDWNATGEPVWVLVVKSSFDYTVDGTVKSSGETDELIPADQYPEDDPAKHSPSASSELAPFKQGAEILLHAYAHSETPRKALHVKAEFKNQNLQWQKKLVAIGPRIWKRSLLGMTFDDPQPITDLPIHYEYAYGGHHPEKETDYYAPNPIGMGYMATKKAAGVALPQIEDPDRMIKNPRQKPVPAGFGPLAVHWQPRVGRFPEIDEDKLNANEFPYVTKRPANLYNAAPEDQQFNSLLAGDASLTLTGLTKGRPASQPLQLNWSIPAIQARLIRRNTIQTEVLKADTLVVDTEKQRLHLLYRHAFSNLPERFQAQIEIIEQEIASV